MRLINSETLLIQEFLSEDELPEFAILSHTWGRTGEECTLQDMTHPSVSAKPGYQKIKLCCDQALTEGLAWAWIDTCCIDKTSTAELSEAINSMFRWYRKAKVCYAYLFDVTTDEDVAKSKWFTRGWTLQELLAPRDVRFYSGAWKLLGSKASLKRELSLITGIDEAVLASIHFDSICIARRMSWAANRQTTRTEDKAYSLMGIFGVNMPLLYGEGNKAFLRLQEEILKTSDDHSLFAWGLPETLVSTEQFDANRQPPEARELHSIFANTPADFVSSHHVQHVDVLQPDVPPIVSANGVHIRLPVWERRLFTFAAISCVIRGNYRSYIGLVLYQWSQTCFARLKDLVLIPASEPNRIGLLIKAPAGSEFTSQPRSIFQISINRSRRSNQALELIDVFVLPHAVYSEKYSILHLPDGPRQGPHAALILRPSKNYDILGDWALIIGGHASNGEKPWAVLMHILYKATDELAVHVTRHHNRLTLTCPENRDLRDILHTFFREEEDWVNLGKQEIHHEVDSLQDYKANTQVVARPAYLSRRYREEVHLITPQNKGTSADWNRSAIDVKVNVTNVNIVERGIFVNITVCPVAEGPDRSLTKSWWEFPGLSLGVEGLL